MVNPNNNNREGKKVFGVIPLEPLKQGAYQLWSEGIWQWLKGDDLSDGTIPPALRDKEWGDHPKEKPKENIKPEPDFAPNTNEDTNPVYNPPRRIYDEEDDNFRNNPKKPDSNLQIDETEETLNQENSKVVIGKAVTLAQAIKNQEFGRLLYNPVKNKRVKIRQVVDTSLQQKLVELNNSGLEEFQKYLLDDSNKSLFDACVLALPQSLRGLAGNLGLIFGSEAIRILAFYFTSASQNTYIGVEDGIPLGYEVIFEAPNYSPNKLVVDSVKMTNFKDFRKLVLGDTEKLLLEWEYTINRAIEESYDPQKLLEVRTEAKSVADLLLYILAPFFRRLGLNDYPLLIPKDLTQEPENGQLEEFVSAQSLVDFLLTQYTTLDGIFGQFPINIRIEDNDLIKTGDQAVDIKLPNIAETLAELTGKTLTNEALINALLTVSLKNIAETGSNKQTSIQNYYLLTAIQEYLGFKTRQKSTEVDLLFNPSVVAKREDDQSLTEALQNSKIKVPIEINDDEDSLEEQLKILVEAARISKAVHWRGVDLKGDIFNQLKSTFLNAGNLADQLSDKDKESLEEFLNSLQLGFANKSGNIDSTKPFGRDYNRRPRVKKLDTNE